MTAALSHNRVVMLMDEGQASALAWLLSDIAYGKLASDADYPLPPNIRMALEDLQSHTFGFCNPLRDS